MLTALDAPPESFDEHERSVLDRLRKYGFFAHHIFPETDLPGFSYTTGIWKTADFPELILFSIESDKAHKILWNLFDAVMAGRRLPIGERIGDVLKKGDVVLLPVDKSHYRELLG